jgi:hypothetical protein
LPIARSEPRTRDYCRKTEHVRNIVGGVLSPLLANIYLNELDRYVEDTLIPAYTQGERRKANPAYTRFYGLIRDAEKRAAFEEVKRLKQQRRTLMSVDPLDANYRRLRYIRYADDFLLGFIGPKKEAEAIRQKLGDFLEQKLKLTLSKEKTLITHAVDGKATFLGYEIKVTRDGDLISANEKRATNGKIALLMPQKVIHKYRDRYGKGGTISPRFEWIADTDYTVIRRYQTVLRGIYNYYCMAVNVGNTTRMAYLKWILETSLTKTLATKFRCSVTEIYRRYQMVVRDRKVLQVVIKRPDKEPLVATFGGVPFERIPEGMGTVDFSFQPAWFAAGDNRSEVVRRLLAGKCELCGAKGPLEVHHIRRVADIDRPGRRPKTAWEKLLSVRKRKTLVTCRRCHDHIHAGQYDGPPL